MQRGQRRALNSTRDVLRFSFKNIGAKSWLKYLLKAPENGEPLSILRCDDRMRILANICMIMGDGGVCPMTLCLLPHPSPDLPFASRPHIAQAVWKKMRKATLAAVCGEKLDTRTRGPERYVLRFGATNSLGPHRGRSGVFGEACCKFVGVTWQCGNHSLQNNRSGSTNLPAPI